MDFRKSEKVGSLLQVVEEMKVLDCCVECTSDAVAQASPVQGITYRGTLPFYSRAILTKFGAGSLFHTSIAVLQRNAASSAEI